MPSIASSHIMCHVQRIQSFFRFLFFCFLILFVYIVNMISVVYYLFTLCISVTIVYWVHCLNHPECIVSFGSSCLKKYCTCLNIYCMYHSKRNKKKCLDVIIYLTKAVLSLGSSLDLSRTGSTGLVWKPMLRLQYIRPHLEHLVRE